MYMEKEKSREIVIEKVKEKHKHILTRIHTFVYTYIDRKRELFFDETTCEISREDKLQRRLLLM